MTAQEEHIVQATMALRSAAVDADIQEALSLRYSDRAIVILQLKSGRFAVFDNLRALCGVVESLNHWPPTCWRAPPPPNQTSFTKTPKTIQSRYELDSLPSKQSVNLKELGLA